ncbi:ribosomal RNA methyltransferase FtsJ domain-containing protein [Rhodocollybia butyracea]|uniref:rRNA methyltransferase 2, mitochondrial n=1 Tax=Rhodocollybia butyracea TaxID=206335 RepID=A0A9P5PYR3_9AGAR|nr:ribosomal RNA methyltransferase FtsJ domain-containing protein [Rhodocollybia butyracea]
MSFRPSFPSFAKTKKSSTEWLRRQTRDPFVKQRALGAKSSILGFNKDGILSIGAFRSRSAFKLLEMQDRYDFLTNDVRVVVDLGAAPGGWSQVVSQVVSDSVVPIDEDSNNEASQGFEDEEEKEDENSQNFRRKWQRKRIVKPKPKLPIEFYDPLNFDAEPEHPSQSSSSKVKIIAVDRLSMDPIPGVSTLKADFLHPATENMIRSLIDGSPSSAPQKIRLSPEPPKVDVVLSDIAPNLTGVPAGDSQANLFIAQAVFQFTQKYLRTADEVGRSKGGVLVLKHFAHPTMDSFRKDVLEKNFRDVTYTKPKASRQESGEGYFICRGFMWSPYFYDYG